MKRVAIILGSPYPENSRGHLRGVSADVENYKKFLMSSSGGSWLSSEIHTGIHITKAKTEVIQRLCHEADIALIVYSGHGFMVNGENYLNINPRQCLGVSELITTAKRQITIIDACRTDYPYDHFAGIGDPGLYFDNSYPELGRAMYDHFIKNSPEGTFTVFSSSANQASEDTEDGGRFTTSLLDSVRDWVYDSNAYHLTLEEAFYFASDSLANESAFQVPEAYYTGNQIPNFPFCVNPRAYVARFGEPKAISGHRTITKKRQGSPVVPVLAGIAATIIIASWLSDE